MCILYCVVYTYTISKNLTISFRSALKFIEPNPLNDCFGNCNRSLFVLFAFIHSYNQQRNERKKFFSTTKGENNKKNDVFTYNVDALN